jgi:NADH dehydrogenase
VTSERRRVVIVGGGFAGLNAARQLGAAAGLDVTLVDRRNHHLFQPLLYQVAMAGLSPADIAVPIRTLLSRFENVRVIQGRVQGVDLAQASVSGDFGTLGYDYLVLASGAQHAYFGNERWERFAPGLKTLEQATEIRRRVLSAYELAEREGDSERRRQHLSFVIVGGGPTGVELAGAIGEMSRFTLARDFRNIDPKLTRVILVEAGARILPSFSARLASRATRDLEMLGVQVWTHSLVTDVDEGGVRIGEERIGADTVLWAAGVHASELGQALGAACDAQGRVLVGEDLTVPGHSEVFVLGDLAHVQAEGRAPLPGTAPVAMQQGRYAARAILDAIAGRPKTPFRYFDKGQMATIGRSRAIVQIGRLELTGLLAWLTWLLVHIYYLSSFEHRLLVLIQWAFSYVTFARGARLIVGKQWRSYPESEGEDDAGGA